MWSNDDEWRIDGHLINKWQEVYKDGQNCRCRSPDTLSIHKLHKNFANELKWKSTWTIKMEIEKLGWNIQRTAIWKIMKWNEVTSMKWINPHEQSPMNKAPWIRTNELNERTREEHKKRIQLTRLEFEDDEVLFEDILLGRPRRHTKNQSRMWKRRAGWPTSLGAVREMALFVWRWYY